jgi:hypothetical protein
MARAGRVLVWAVAFGLAAIVLTVWMLWLRANVASGVVQGALFALAVLAAVRVAAWAAGRADPGAERR